MPPQLISAQAGTIEAPSPLPSILVVYVCGAVHKPGVYRLSPAARIIDGVRRAGGAASDADVEQLNLAAPAADGMKIVVPHKGQALSSASMVESLTSSTSAANLSEHRARHSRGGSGRHKLQPGQTLNINTATEQELTTLPGVGPGLARRILEYRGANGPFQSVDDLQNVSGIGPSKFEKMSPYIKL